MYLEDDKGYRIIIPNNTVFAADIVNYNYRPSELVELTIEMHPEAVAELTDWEMKLKESLRPHEDQLVNHDTQIFIQNILLDKVQVAIQFRVKLDHTNLKKQLVHAVLQQFAAAKVHS